MGRTKRLFEVKVWVVVEADSPAQAEEKASSWVAAMPKHRGIRNVAVEGEGSTYEMDPDA